MAVKRSRRSLAIIQSHKFFQLDGKNDKNCRRSCRLSGLDSSQLSSPKMSPKNKNLSLCEKDLCSMATERIHVASSNLRSSHKCSENEQNRIENKEKVKNFKKKQEQDPSFRSPKTSMNRKRSLKGYKVNKKLPAMFNKSSSLLPLETCILTRLQRKSLDLNMKRKKKSENSFSKLCSMNTITDLPKHSTRKRRSYDYEISEQSALESPKTPLRTRTKCVNPTIDCLTLNHSNGIVESKRVLSQEKVKRRSPRNANVYSDMRKEKYHLRSQSEKTSNPVKPLSQRQKRIKSLPIDDLVYTNSKIVFKNNCKEVGDPKSVAKYTPVQLKAKNGSRVPKVSEKKSLKAKKSKSLPRKSAQSRMQTSPIYSKLNLNTKRKINTNNHSQNKDSNPVIKSTRSSISTVKNTERDISLHSENIVKKSKRHTFPKCSLNGKYYVSSQNHLKTSVKAYDKKLNSIKTWNRNPINHENVPLDDLTVLPNSFRTLAVRSRSSRTVYVTSTPIKHISKKSPLQDKSGVSSKSKKAAKFGKVKQTSNSPENLYLGLPSSIPKKGTLKRKRWIFNTLKERNDGYEDDLFESKKFDKMKAALQMSDDESDTTDNSIATPKCGFILTPSLPKKTPMFKDCISSLELLEARKNAEEYLYRRNKKWKSGTKDDTGKQNSTIPTGTSEKEIEMPEKRKLDYSMVLQNVIAAQKSIEKLAQDESEEEDAYFSEASD